MSLQRRNYIISSVTLITLALLFPYLYRENTFEKRYGTPSGPATQKHNESSSSLIQVSDGGYMLLGTKVSYTPTNIGMYLVKTDSKGNELWSKTYSGKSDSTASSIIQASDGGYLLLGDSASFGANAYDMYLVKTDPEGNELWNKTYGGKENNFGFSLIENVDGGYMLVGSTGASDARKGDIYLVKTDSNGNELWSKTYGGIGNDTAFSILQSSDKGFLLLGTTESFGAGNRNVYLVKTDSNGNELWSKTFGGKGAGFGSSIIKASDDGYLLSGLLNASGTGGDDIYLVKVDAEGNEQWSKTYGGEGDEYGASLARSDDGGYVVFGRTSTAGSKLNDMYLVKVDVEGNELWSKTYGGAYDDTGSSVIQSSDGGYVLLGTTYVLHGSWYDKLVVKLPPHIYENIPFLKRATGRVDASSDLYLLKVDKNGKL